MFSLSVARLRLAFTTFLLASPLVRAREQSLFTSSVTYCSPPESLLIERFDVAYFARNQSIVFDITAASVDPNTNVNANLVLNVYGMSPFNVTIDICSLFGGALCPLPVYTFNGSDSISLPDSLDVDSQIPAIAYVIPDLEAFAQLNLTDVKTGEVKACVQTTLSNGWSTHQYAVEWSTGSVAISFFALALWQSIAGPQLGLAPVRLLDTLSLFQTIALSGLLSLNFPTLYRSFTLNFAWSLGLFAASTSSSIQQSINRMRHLTGGALSNASSDAISFVNRQLSPYNVNNNAVLLSQSLAQYTSSLPDTEISQLLRPNTTGVGPQVLINDEVATVTQDSSNVLQAGIPIYTNSIGIATANAFMTVFFVALILAAIVLGSLALIYAVTICLGRTKYGRNHPSVHEFQQRYPSFARSWCLRVAMVSSLPILVFAFYQWTLKDSWLSVLLSVLLLLALMVAILPPTFFAVRPSLPTTRWKELVPSSATEPITSPYRPNRLYYFVLLLVVTITKALVTGFGQSHGMAQIIVFVVLEFFIFLSIIVMKPHPTRGADVLAGYLCITRLVCSGLMLAFTETLSVKAIPRVAIGAIIAVIFSVACVVMFFNLLFHALVQLGLWRFIALVFTCGRRGRRQDHTSLPSQLSDPSLVEKAQPEVVNLDAGDEMKDSATLATKPSRYLVDRPENPSPPSTASFAPPSPQSATSSTTLGDTLPRRWSFQHSRPPSISTDALHSPAQTHRTSTASSPISGQRHSRNISSTLPTPLEEVHKYEARAL